VRGKHAVLCAPRDYAELVVGAAGYMRYSVPVDVSCGLFWSA